MRIPDNFSGKKKHMEDLPVHQNLFTEAGIFLVTVYMCLNIAENI